MSTADEISDLYRQLLTAWNERDAAAFAECFSADGIMIGFDGSVVTGPAEILNHLTPIFADHPTAAFVAVIRTIRATADAHLLLADAGMVPPGAAETIPEANARQTVVAEPSSTGWTIALFQNTPAALHWNDAEREALSAELNAALAERGPLPLPTTEQGSGIRGRTE